MLRQSKGAVWDYFQDARLAEKQVDTDSYSSMTPKSIRSHLTPYSIFSKRKTTVAHAFASALAPSDEYDKEKVETALEMLGQKNLKQLSCVYCDRLAQTWDHLENLVKDGKLNGYGHQIGNLVPCCRDCNSQKGGKPFRDFINSNEKLTEDEKLNLILRLEAHLALAKPIEPSNLSPDDQETLNKFLALQTQILGLMEEADRYARILRLQNIESKRVESHFRKVGADDTAAELYEMPQSTLRTEAVQRR